MLVGACIAGPPTVRGQILGSAGTANAGSASPAPTMKSRNSAYNYTHLSRFIVGVGLCSTRRAFPPHTTQKKTRKRNRSQVLFPGAPSAGAFRKQCSALFLATESRGLTNTALWCWLPPAGGRPVLVHGASQKRAPDPKIGGFFWCTIGDSNPGPTD